MVDLRKHARQRAEMWLHTIFERSGGACEICGCPVFLRKRPAHWGATIDHILPVSKGGSGELDNLQLACKPCNSAKDDAVPEDERVAAHEALGVAPPAVVASPGGRVPQIRVSKRSRKVRLV